MNILPYFARTSLLAHFSHAIEQAQIDTGVGDDTLSLGEGAWLNRLATPAHVPEGMIVQTQTNALTDSTRCLIIQHTDPTWPAVYLYSPLRGVRAFANLALLYRELGTRTHWLPDPVDGPQLTRLEGDPFSAWSNLWIQQRQARLTRLNTALDHLPTLQATLDECLKASFAKLLKGIAKPAGHPLRIVRRSDTTVARILCLSEVALDALANVKLASGYTRQFLATDDQTAEGFDDRCETALAKAVESLPTAFATALDTWGSSQTDGHTDSPLDLLAVALCDGFVHSLLRAASEGTISGDEFEWLRGALTGADSPPQLAMLDYAYGEPGNRQRVTAAGVLILYSNDSRQTYFRYSPVLGLQRFDVLNTLTAACFKELTLPTPLPHVSAQDWQALAQATNTTLELDDLGPHPFHELATSLIELAKHRLAQTFTRAHASAPHLVASSEDALNIRALIDCELPGLTRAGAGVSDTNPGDEARLGPASPHANTPTGWKLQLADINARLQCLCSGLPRLSACVEQSFALPFAALTQGKVQPGSLRLNSNGNVQTFTDYVLQHLSDTSEAPRQLAVLDLQNTPLIWPLATDIQRLVTSRKSNVQQDVQTSLEAYDCGRFRLGAASFDVLQQRTTLFESLLRLELAMNQRKKRVPTDLLHTFSAVLDHSAPVQAQAVELRLPDQATPIRLSMCYVFSDPNSMTGGLLLWSPQYELCDFDSVMALNQSVNRSFAREEEREAWLKLIDAQSQASVERHFTLPKPDTALKVELKPINGGLMADFSREDRRRRAAHYRLSFQQALKEGFNAQLLTLYVDQQARREPVSSVLQHLEQAINTEHTLERIPAWVRTASSEEIDVFGVIVQSCVRAADPRNNYLFDIPDLDVFTKAKLIDALKADHPQWPSDPDDIEITLKSFTSSIPPPGEIPSSIPAASHLIRQSLTDCALTHFATLNVASITVQAKNASPGHILPNANEVRTLIDRLDIGEQYRQLLGTRLAPTDTDYIKRRELFGRRLVPFMLAETFQYMLQKKLSPQGFYTLCHTLLMPDATARTALSGVQLQFCQFQLRASSRLDPDTILGVYLIGPQAPSQGPVVLYDAYSDQQVASEFKDQRALLDALKKDKALQDRILARIAPEVRSRYAHNGFSHPHLQWSSSDLFDYSPGADAVQLHCEPVLGNALHHVFDEHVQVLKQLARSRTISTAEADWSAFRYLMTLGVEQVSMFIPSHLGLLLNLWQSTQWVQSAFQSAKKQNWGQSLAELATALMLLTSGHSVPRRSNRPGETASTAAAATEHVAVAEKNTSLELALENRLAPFEALDVQLNGMTRLEQPGLFQNPSHKHYAVVAGKIYEVQNTANRWQIVQGKERGPLISPSADQQWQVDTQQGLRGGGLKDAYEQAFADADIKERFITLASGMPAIRSTHWLKYQMLQQAHQQAQDYLSICLRNLNTKKPWEPLHADVEHILAETFDTPSTPKMLAELRDYTQRLLNDLLSEGMSPDTGTRYVVGMNLQPGNLTTAFTYRYDPRKRIFLTERFFTLPAKVAAYGTSSETQMRVHQQAVTLIHELTHQKLRTVDIAYVESNTPFLDQLDQSTANGRLFHEEQRLAKQEGLSLSTPDELLFAHYDLETGTWRDLKSADGRTKQVILKLTQCATLAEARTAFRTDAQKRVAIKLANADSLALLISELGRRRFTTPTQSSSN